LAYPKLADEFVRLILSHVRTGWRRDEWAYSPLFIWGKPSGRAQQAPETQTLLESAALKLFEYIAPAGGLSCLGEGTGPGRNLDLTGRGINDS
jgi:hypothetical protein